MATSSSENKNALFIPDDTRDIATKRVNEKVLMEENTSRVRRDTYGNAWIVGSSTNGLVGANTVTQGGGQQVVGGSGRVISTLAVVNPNNTYREHFRDTTFRDSGNTTAEWNTTLFRIRMSSSDDHTVMYNTHATSDPIAYNDGTVQAATLTVTEHKWSPTDVIRYFLSADGGTNWEEVQAGTEHEFSNTGTDLRFKILFIGNGGSESWIDELKVVYAS